MVPLPQILASNALLRTTLPQTPIAVFAGATTGIGLATLKSFVKHTVSPRIYFLARNVPVAEVVVAECKGINSKAEFHVVEVDLSSVRATDRACQVVLEKEEVVNLLVMSAGEVRGWGELSPESLHRFLTTVYYTRIRLAQNLLPLLIRASATTPLARVLDIAGGTKEGPIDPSDLACLRTPFAHLRGHLASMHTLSLESLADQAPTVSFVQDFPGKVMTPLFEGGSGWLGFGMRLMGWGLWLVQRWVCVPIEECGERHVFMGTSAKYAPGEGNAAGVRLVDGVVAGQPTENARSCVYSVDWDGEGPGEHVMGLLKDLRRKGIKELVWEHTNGEFERIVNGKGL